MSESFVEIDHLPEDFLPAHARDGGAGDRVTLMENGLLEVRSGVATFARWSDVLGVIEHAGSAYVLVPRRSPAPPWIELESSQLGGDDVATFAARVRERGAAGGYRDAVRARRQGLAPHELKAKVLAREPVGGALEVPSTIVLGRSYPGLGVVQALLVMGGGLTGYIGIIAVALMLDLAHHGSPRQNPSEPFGPCMAFAPLLGIVLGAYAARALGRWWRARKDRGLPRQRVLVLAPDGCMVGFRAGAAVLPWSSVGAFEVGPTQPSYELGLVVKDVDGRVLGDVEAGWLDAPLGLVVAVAEAYRGAAG